MLLLLLKLTLAPGLVAVATLLARRLGPRVGGLLAGTPIVAGPILLVVLIEQGRAFGTVAARGALLGMLPTLLFCLAYAWTASRRPPPVALAAAVVAYATTFALLAVLGDPPVTVALVVALVATACVGAAVRRLAAPGVPATGTRGDLLAVRVVITAVLLVVVTDVAGGVAPHVAGLLVPFPIITAVLAVFTHASGGAPAVVALLGGLTRSLLSFLAFFAVLAVLLPRTGTPAAFACAVVATLVAMALLLGADRTRQPKAATETSSQARQVPMRSS